MKHKIINGWTKKSIMEQVKKYNDGTKAMEPLKGGCTYKTFNGNRCAVGCFIPDDHPGLSYLDGARNLVLSFPTLESLMPFGIGLNKDSLKKFQDAHDQCKGNVHEAIQKFLDEECEE